MKKIFTILAITFSYFFMVSAQTEKLNQIFDKYQDTEGVTSIKIAKPMFSMLSKLDIDDSELDQIKPLLNKINGLKILIIEKPNAKDSDSDNKMPLMNYDKLKGEIFSSVKNLNYEELVTVNSKDNKIKILSSDTNNGLLNNLLINILSDDNAILMMLDGKISMEDVNKLVNDIENSEKTSPKTITENISEEGVTQVRDVEKFNKIEVSTGVKVNFSQDQDQFVIVETDADKQKYVTTEVVNQTLKIGIKNNEHNTLNFKKLLVKVQAPELKSVKTSSGSSFITINEINGDNITISSSSGSHISGDFSAADKITVVNSSGANQKLNLSADQITCETTSGSTSNITGTAKNATLNSSSAGSCNAQNLEVKNVNATASSASTLRVNATESLTATSSSGANIRYNGKPKSLNSNHSSGGSVKPID